MLKIFSKDTFYNKRRFSEALCLANLKTSRCASLSRKQARLGAFPRRRAHVSIQMDISSLTIGTIGTRCNFAILIWQYLVYYDIFKNIYCIPKIMFSVFLIKFIPFAYAVILYYTFAFKYLGIFCSKVKS